MAASGAGRRLCDSGQCGDRAISGADRRRLQRLFVRRDCWICEERVGLRRALPGRRPAGRLRSQLDRPRDGQEHRRRRAARPLQWDKFEFYAGYIYSLSVNPSNPNFPGGVSAIARGDRRSPRLRDDQRLYGSAQSSMRSGLACAMRCGPILTWPPGVYWESQNDFLAAARVCTGSVSATSNSRCAGSRYSYSSLVDYQAHSPRRAFTPGSCSQRLRRRRMRLSSHRKRRADCRHAHSLLKLALQPGCRRCSPCCNRPGRG